MPVTLPQGTKEHLIVDVADLLTNLVTLDGTTPKFDVKNDADVLKYTQQAATNQVMRLFCLIDTNSGGIWAAGTYRLYVYFTTAPELPKLGPFSFIVDAS
jgi:hypothetical protein